MYFFNSLKKSWNFHGGLILITGVREIELELKLEQCIRNWAGEENRRDYSGQRLYGSKGRGMGEKDWGTERKWRTG